MKIIFIGNSYTFYNDLPKLFQSLATENSHSVEYREVLCGGRHLYDYLDRPDEYKVKLDAILETETFDYAILQDHSVGAMIEPERFHDAVKRMKEKFGDRVKKIVLYATWGRKEGSATLAEHGWTRLGMTETIAHEYRLCAENNRCAVSPVGECFADVMAHTDVIDLYNPDLTHPSYEGSCLAAIMHFATIFGVLPEKSASLNLPDENVELFSRVVKQYIV